MKNKIKINKVKTASLFVDAQNGFTPLCPDELPINEGHLIVDELLKIKTLASLSLASGDEHPSEALYFSDEENPQFSPAPEGKDMDIRWNAHCVKGTFGADLIEGLPRKDEYDLYISKGEEKNKHPYGMCYHDLANTETTGAIEFLKEKKIETVLVGGLATDYCVANSVKQLLNANFNVIVNLAACRGADPKTTEEAIKEMKDLGAIIVESSKDLY